MPFYYYKPLLQEEKSDNGYQPFTATVLLEALKKYKGNNPRRIAFVEIILRYALQHLMQDQSLVEHFSLNKLKNREKSHSLEDYLLAIINRSDITVSGNRILNAGIGKHIFRAILSVAQIPGNQLGQISDWKIHICASLQAYIVDNFDILEIDFDRAHADFNGICQRYSKYVKESGNQKLQNAFVAMQTELIVLGSETGLQRQLKDKFQQLCEAALTLYRVICTFNPNAEPKISATLGRHHRGIEERKFRRDLLTLVNEYGIYCSQKFLDGNGIAIDTKLVPRYTALKDILIRLDVNKEVFLKGYKVLVEKFAANTPSQKAIKSKIISGVEDLVYRGVVPPKPNPLSIKSISPNASEQKNHESNQEVFNRLCVFENQYGLTDLQQQGLRRLTILAGQLAGQTILPTPDKTATVDYRENIIVRTKAGDTNARRQLNFGVQ